MATVTRTTTWSDNQVLTATALNSEFNNLLNALALTNSDIAGGAGIVYSKLTLTNSIVNADISASAAIATSKINTTFPTGTIVGTTDSQSLSNKTLTKPTVTASVQTVTALSGTTPTVDGSTANVFTITLTGSATFQQCTNVTTGQFLLVEARQGSGTTYTITWTSFGTITWVTSGGTAPTQTTISNGYTVYGFHCTGANTYLGFLVASN